MTDACEWLDIPISSKNTIQCPNPSHEDKNPSCSIKDDEYCYCFGCGFSAKPLKLIMTHKNISKWGALKFINQHTKIFEQLNEDFSDDLHLTPWEKGCLGLKHDPLFPYTNRIPIENESTKKKTISVSTGEISKIEAFEIINDKYIEYCATESLFLNRFRNYVGAVLNELQAGNKGVPHPSQELWRYNSPKAFQEAVEQYEARIDKLAINATGLRYSVLLQWHLEGRPALINAAVMKKGKQYYEELTNKVNTIIVLLEKEEQRKEVEEQYNIQMKEADANGREMFATMA